MKRIYYLFLMVISIQGFQSRSTFAQLNPLGAQYFQNQYLGNPALAGTEQGMDLNMGVRQQWSNIPGSPTMQAFTAVYGLNNKVGLGLNLSNDKSGLFKRTRALASYAYHLPLNNENKKLSFGLSMGIMNERITLEEIQGNPNDIQVGTFNQRETYIDGDFGLAYTGTNFNLQAAIPNMKNYLGKDLNRYAVNRATFFSAVSYKFNFDGTTALSFEPKVAYRGVRGMRNIIDAGANLSYANNMINFFGMYHSINSTTFGLGLNYQNIGFIGMYSTATSALSNYANGNFEVSMRVNIF